MDRKYDVYGLGNAIMDLQLQASDSDLAKFGLEKGSMTLVEPEAQKSLLEHFQGARINQASGGSAANTMIALAQLGNVVSYGCVVGDDRYGEDYFNEMDKLGVGLYTEPVAERPTGTCVILIAPDAERTMCTHLGASVELDVEHVSEEIISESRWLYIEGYLFSQASGQRVVKKAIEYAKAHKTKIAVTFSDKFIVDIFGEPLRDAVRQSDLVFANMSEACAFVGETDVEKAYKAFASQFPTAVMTLSANGARCRANGKDYVIAPFPTKAVDDTGAGDMFAGGFLHGLLAGATPDEAGKMACFLASKVVSQLGPRLHYDLGQLLGGEEFLRA